MATARKWKWSFCLGLWLAEILPAGYPSLSGGLLSGFSWRTGSDPHARIKLCSCWAAACPCCWTSCGWIFDQDCDLLCEGRISFNLALAYIRPIWKMFWSSGLEIMLTSPHLQELLHGSKGWLEIIVNLNVELLGASIFVALRGSIGC